MKGSAEDISRTMTTKAGPVLVLARNEECKQPLIQLKLSDGTKLRETKPRAAIAQEADLTEELQRPCKRIISARLNSIETWKVKMLCQSKQDKSEVTHDGVYIGHQKHRVERGTPHCSATTARASRTSRRTVPECRSAESGTRTRYSPQTNRSATAA